MSARVQVQYTRRRWSRCSEHNCPLGLQPRGQGSPEGAPPGWPQVPAPPSRARTSAQPVRGARAAATRRPGAWLLPGWGWQSVSVSAVTQELCWGPGGGGPRPRKEGRRVPHSPRKCPRVQHPHNSSPRELEWAPLNPSPGGRGAAPGDLRGAAPRPPPAAAGRPDYSGSSGWSGAAP